MTQSMFDKSRRECTTDKQMRLREHHVRQWFNKRDRKKKNRRERALANIRDKNWLRELCRINNYELHLPF